MVGAPFMMLREGVAGLYVDWVRFILTPIVEEDTRPGWYLKKRLDVRTVVRPSLATSSAPASWARWFRPVPVSGSFSSGIWDHSEGLMS